MAAVIYGSFGLATWYADLLPWWVLLPLGAFIVCWHGSLQHEAVHGHPTPWRWLNELLVFPSLWLWLPFGLYREFHLSHHRNEVLTDPLEDPESYYVTREAWERMGPIRRALLVARNSVAGRLTVGASMALVDFARDETARLAGGDLRHLPHWLLHAVAVAVVLAWVVGVCGMSVWAYAALFAFPGHALTMLRSFLEHRAVGPVDQRTAVVEAGPLMSLLFLNNNLHAVHHDLPGLAWYRLPARYRQARERYLRQNGGYLMTGYGEVLRHYLLRPKEAPVHPGQPVLVTIRTAAGASRV